MTEERIDRIFVRLKEGLVHLRRVEATKSDGIPLVLLHASPGSSKGLVPLLAALAETQAHPLILAPDTLGHGDSAPTLEEAPDVATYAEATVRLLDVLGIERAAIYGAHTGARIACELGVLRPDRVERVIVDGIGEYRGALQDELVARYAPEMEPDDYGTQFQWAFQFVRDQALHFPHYARDPAHRLMTRAVPDASALHDAALEVLKGLKTYHRAYRAAFRYPTGERIAALHVPLELLQVDSELPALRAQALKIVGTHRAARIHIVDETQATKATRIIQILNCS